MIDNMFKSDQFMLGEDLPNILKYLLGLSLSIDVHILLQLIIILDDLPSLRLIRHKPLLNTLQIVIRPATSLTALQQSGQHHLLSALEVKNEGDIDSIIHQFLPSGQVLNVPRETVNQKPTPLYSRPLHRFLQQHDRDLARNYLPLNDVSLDRLPELRTRLLALCPQKVTCGKMHELELVLDALALSTLTRTRPAEDEDNCGLFVLHGYCQ